MASPFDLSVFDHQVVQIYGMEEFLSNVKTIKDQMQEAVLKKAVTSGAALIKDAAVGLCPVGKEAREASRHWAHGEEGGTLVASKHGGRYPGQLRDSITMRVRLPGPGAAGADVGPGPAGFYGTFLEFGTRKMAARPFMRPAVDEKGDEAAATVMEIMRQFLDSVEAA